MNKLTRLGQRFASLFPLLPAHPTAHPVGEHLEVDIWLTFEQAALGAQKTIQYIRPGPCSLCHGRGLEPGHASSDVDTRNPCSHCRGEGLEYRLTETQAYIPPGTDAGVRVRLPGQADPAEGEVMPKNDLYLCIHVWPHKYFRRQGMCIFLDVKINVTQAVLGTVAQVPTLYGWRPLPIPAGTHSGTALVLCGEGVPASDVWGEPGDQIVRVHVRIPTHLTKAQRCLLTRLGATYKENL